MNMPQSLQTVNLLRVYKWYILILNDDFGGYGMKFAKAVRVITIPQIMAFVLLTILYIADASFFASLSHYLLGILFLTVFPMLAYPIAWLFKKTKDMRSTERTLAISLCIAGYIGGVLLGVLDNGTETEKIVFFTYLFSGILTALLSFVFKIKSSGHACGVAGPTAMLIYRLGWIWLLGIVLLAAAYWCSLKLKRHTPAQLIIGTAVPIAAMAVSILIVVNFGI